MRAQGGRPDCENLAQHRNLTNMDRMLTRRKDTTMHTTTTNIRRTHSKKIRTSNFIIVPPQTNSEACQAMTEVNEIWQEWRNGDLNNIYSLSILGMQQNTHTQKSYLEQK
jgi:hypothetical protein